MEGLLERDAELQRLLAMLDGARTGQGGVAVVEGPPGIGKSRLLDAARDAAAGFQVLSARGGELERDFPWGVVRQLFELPVVLADATEREELLEGAASHAAEPLGLAGGASGAGAADAGFAALHGLHWLTVNLAARTPLLLVVDDAHWADDASRRFLTYLARRVAELPVVLLVGQRPHEGGLEEGDVIELRALTAAGSRALVGAAWGREPDDAFARACHEAAGGNPFLLTALVGSLRDEGMEPVAGSAGRVSDAGPPAVARHVRRRVAALGEEAVRLAQAVAILGTDTDVRRAASLAGLEPDRAGRAADGLAAVDVLRPGRPLDFVHPVVRAAVRDDLPAADRMAFHRRAAEMLAVEGAGPGRVAVHLLATEPRGDAWVAGVLREAAERAVERGAADAAGRFLQRAVAEPPDAAERPAVLRDLGRVALLAGDPAALEHYRAAVDASADPAQRAAIGREGGVAAVPNGQYLEAVATLERALADAEAAGDDELARLIEADLCTASMMAPQTVPAGSARAERRLEALEGLDGSPGGRALLCNLAFQCCIGGHRADEAAALAGRGLADGPPIDPTRSNTQWNGGFALMMADELDGAAAMLEGVRAEARRRGSALTVARASMFLAMVAYRRGDIRACIDEAQTSIELASGRAWFLRRMATGLLVDGLRERGDLDGAREALATVDAAEGPIENVFMWNFLLFARGRLRVACGDPGAGLADLEEVGRREAIWFGDNPAAMPWRSAAARALIALGRSEEAAGLAARELELAIAWGTPRGIGVARHTIALAASGDRTIAGLERAVADLEESPAVLELAHALVDLGAARRRRGRRSAARDPLRRGIDIAHRCGANGLAEQGLIELRAAGGRPRRLALAGVDALTPSERRVAHLAATGLTNREIAQTLFVTLRTVEVHLTHAYAKLGITTRNELPGVLGLAEPQAVAAD